MNRRSLEVLGVLMLLACGVVGCGDLDREILDRLSADEQARFRRGQAAALPCWTCHDLAGEAKLVGPSLLGIYGRRSGQAPDFEASAALRAASIVWDDRSLSAFLADPARFIPGNAMVSPGIENSGRRSDLLFYLRHVSRPGARDGLP